MDEVFRMRDPKRIAINVLKVLPFAALLFTALAALAAEKTEKAENPPVSVEKVRSYREGASFFTEIQFKSEGPKWSSASIDVKFFNDGIQVDVPHAFLTKGKQVVKVEDRLFAKVFASQADPTTLRIKFDSKDGFNAKAFAPNFQVRRIETGVIFSFEGEGVAKAAAGVGDEAIRFAVADDGDFHSESAPVKLIAGAQTDTSSSEKVADQSEAKALPAAATAKLPENQIPVLTNTKVKKAQESNFSRIMITLGVLATLLGAALFGLKKWSGRSTKLAQNTKIKVLTQHHLGPKKSVAILQVAGESILIGITDQNISMLKTLSLIDDEVPVDVPNRFDSELDNYSAEEAPSFKGKVSNHSFEDDQEDFAMQGLADIRDTVSKRLKNMRNL